MIGYLKGTIIDKEDNILVLDVSGVGYQVYTSSPEDIGAEMSLWIYTVVRQDAFQLFGFATKSERSIFMLLLTVPGVGPKSALNILNTAGTEELVLAAREDNPKRLTHISGVGKKMAEKIVIELRDKLANQDFVTSSRAESGNLTEAMEALMSLGYSRDEAKTAVSAFDSKDMEVTEIVKGALRNLSS